MNEIEQLTEVLKYNQNHGADGRFSGGSGGGGGGGKPKWRGKRGTPKSSSSGLDNQGKPKVKGGKYNAKGQRIYSDDEIEGLKGKIRVDAGLDNQGNAKVKGGTYNAKGQRIYSDSEIAGLKRELQGGGSKPSGGGPFSPKGTPKSALDASIKRMPDPIGDAKAARAASAGEKKQYTAPKGRSGRGVENSVHRPPEGNFKREAQRKVDEAARAKQTSPLLDNFGKPRVKGGTYNEKGQRELSDKEASAMREQISADKAHTRFERQKASAAKEAAKTPEQRDAEHEASLDRAQKRYDAEGRSKIKDPAKQAAYDEAIASRDKRLVASRKREASNEAMRLIRDQLAHGDNGDLMRTSQKLVDDFKAAHPDDWAKRARAAGPKKRRKRKVSKATGPELLRMLEAMDE